MGLSAKENTAVEGYCNPSSETYNDWCASYKKANYSLCTGWKRNALKVRHKNHIEGAIASIRAEVQVKNEDAIEFGKCEHLRLKLLCEQKGDMVNATRNLEGYMRSNGAYTDNLNTADTTEQRKLSEKEELEARRVANIMLREDVGEVKEA